MVRPPKEFGPLARLLVLLVVLLAVATTALYFSPVGSYLMTWGMD
ncbi:hypothetical protein [Intrasporangium sp.]